MSFSSPFDLLLLHIFALRAFKTRWAWSVDAAADFSVCDSAGGDVTAMGVTADLIKVLQRLHV